MSFPPKSPAGREVLARIQNGDLPEALRRVKYGESLEERLSALALHPIETLSAEYHLIYVPDGDEQLTVSELAHLHLGFVAEFMELDAISRDTIRSHWLHAQPNFYLHTSAVQLSDLSFPSWYDDYKRMVGFDGKLKLPSTAKVTIKVLDSGVDSGAALGVRSATNYADSSAGATTDDEKGHGTLVAKVIHDLAPDAALHACKVTDPDGRANEWNVLAALAADVGPVDIVNMSLAYGFQDRECKTCGRSAGSSRSKVCKQVLDDLSSLHPKPIVVAAAGNATASELSYPGRFGSVVATGAVTQNGSRASYSNWGSLDDTGAPHENFFVLPGGEATSADCVAERTGPPPQYFAGTSYATAFASGLIANVLAEQDERGRTPDPDQTITHLRGATDTNVGEAGKNGNGLMRLSYLP